MNTSQLARSMKSYWHRPATAKSLMKGDSEDQNRMFFLTCRLVSAKINTLYPLSNACIDNIELH